MMEGGGGDERKGMQCVGREGLRRRRKRRKGRMWTRREGKFSLSPYILQYFLSLFCSVLLMFAEGLIVL